MKLQNPLRVFTHKTTIQMHHRRCVLCNNSSHKPSGYTLISSVINWGAQGNLLPMKLVRCSHINLIPMVTSYMRLCYPHMWYLLPGGSCIKRHGIVTIPCTYQGASNLAPIYRSSHHTSSNLLWAEAADIQLFHSTTDPLTHAVTHIWKGPSSNQRNLPQ